MRHPIRFIKKSTRLEVNGSFGLIYIFSYQTGIITIPLFEALSPLQIVVEFFTAIGIVVNEIMIFS